MKNYEIPITHIWLKVKNLNVVPSKGGGGTGTVGKRKATTSLERKGGRVEYFINSVTIDSRDNTQMEEPRMNPNAPRFFYCY